MSHSKHQKDERPLSDDLERNPGIGQSKGSFATGLKPDVAEGQNTSEGDIENDADNAGKATDELGRTNR